MYKEDSVLAGGYEYQHLLQWQHLFKREEEEGKGNVIVTSKTFTSSKTIQTMFKQNVWNV